MWHFVAIIAYNSKNIHNMKKDVCELLAVDRRKALIEQLYRTGSLTISIASQEFNVSEETIRRDIDKLVLEYPIEKVHGGAYLYKNFEKEPPITLQQNEYDPERSRIAIKCKDFIKNFDSIMLDSSNTALHIARQIKQLDIEVTLITNSLDIMVEVAESKNIKTIGVGGLLRENSHSFVGREALFVVGSFIADKAFLSPSGISTKFGLTDHNGREAEIRRAILKNSQTHFLVMDHAKLEESGIKGINVIGQLSDIHYLITDAAPSKDWAEVLAANDVKLVVAD